MSDIHFFIEKYKTLVESRIGWGKSQDWQSQDFETLSGEIFTKTGVLLSASTLKRIWGKVKYTSIPNLTTLDTLAQFADFPSWRAFCNAHEETAQRETVNPKKRNYRVTILLIGIVCVLAIIVLAMQKKPNKPLVYKNIRFSSQPVTRGIPNTVLFEYEAGDSNADSVFIQQNWDERRRFKVDKYKNEYASIYYLPGYYRAKLVLNDSVVKEHDIFIESDWIGVLDKKPIPIYLPEELYHKEDWLGIRKEDLNTHSEDYQSEVPTFVLTRVDKNMDVPSESFETSMVLQNTFTGVRAPCRGTSVILLGTEGIIRIPLSASGCIGDLHLILGAEEIAGNTRNLSGLGVDFDKPVELKCTVSSGLIRISLDGRIVFKEKFSRGIGRIVGTRISFEGSGLVRDFRLTKL